MKQEWTDKYKNLYASLGLDPVDFDNTDVATLRERVRDRMEQELCSAFLGDCKSDCSGCC